MWLATSTIPANTPYVSFMSNDAALTLPVSSSTLQSIIDFDSAYYAVNPALVRGIIKRESNFNQYAKGDHGTSIGLVQIHLPAHPDVSVIEAENPLFAINFLTQNLATGNCHLWSTCKAAKAALSPPAIDEEASKPVI